MYITPRKWEKRIGWGLLLLGVLLPPLAVPGGIVALGIWYLVLALATGFVFRSFLAQSLQVLIEGIVPFLWKGFLAYVAAQVTVVLLNDLFFFLEIDCFGFGPSGPILHSRYEAAMALLLAENPGAMSLMLIVLIPFVWETLIRGLLFNRVYHKSPTLAFLVSTALLALLHSLPYMQGSLWPDLVLFVQYIPAGLLLGWLYCSTETVFAPMLIHMVIKLDLVCFLFDHYSIP